MPHKSTTTTDFCIRKSRSKSKRFGIFFVIATLLLSPLGMIFGVPTQPANANPIIAADPSTIAACGGNPECFAFSIDTRLDATGGLTNVSNAAFILPTAGLTGGGTIAKAYNWIVNWGDGIGDQNYSGSSNYIGGGINYTYANPGQYQITIRPAATAAMNWMGGFGFYSSDSTGSNAPTNRQQILSIDTPFTNLMRTKGAASRFASVFSGAVNAVGIPDNLFANISTTGDTNFANMFDYAFSDFAYNSTTATIPAGLFDSIDTSSGTNISYMFRNTFQRSAYNSTVATIPAGLFDFFDTSLATSITYLFYNTFSYYAYNSTIATIPPGLFNSITTSQVTTSFVYVFASTFAYYAYSSPIANIPANLFASVDTSRGTNLGNMFNGTFTYFAFSSPNASIPAGLFDSINTSQTTSFSSTFNSTFAYYANSSTVGIIPTDLFDSIDTSVGSNFANTFNNTFSNYARRTASFVVNGTVVQTQTFANTYSTKNTSTDNLPATNPTVNAGNVVVPTYNSTSRNITRPGGAYLDFDWYRTDGTSCAVASPTPNCGPQTTPVTFTNTTEWIPTTSTEWGSVNFYALLPNGTTQIEY
ncbi:hypothetical protein FWG95_03625, partial [Candidatus Saccharibacteria bacterium]|nr:hypothetical protein [Candidatus Saccharibacteria bacterium]